VTAHHSPEGEQDNWEPGRWWRVIDADGGVWCETSDEQEARRFIATAPGGGTLRRLWVARKSEWRDAQ
jgi:hypothetical protein